jgi:osmotically-inducible protein OsmY
MHTIPSKLVLTLLVGTALGAGTSHAAISDPWITTKAKIALLTTEHLDATDIDVDTINGRVTLHGKVPTAVEKEKATSVADSIEGVDAVQNLLQVVPESARARVDDTDAQIESRVEEALDDAPGMDDSDVDVVSVNRGVVLLGGKAATMNDHLQAIATTSRVRGVREVRTEVQSPVELRDDEVYHLDQPTEKAGRLGRGVGEAIDDAGDAAGAAAKATGDAARATGEAATEAAGDVADATRDAWITTATKMALLADPDVPGLDVNVDTADGVVTLFGIVSSAAAKVEAGRIAQGVQGVKEVENGLQVVTSAQQPRVERRDAEVKADVARALERSDLLEQAEIDVEVKNGVARLTGGVPGSAERLAAAYVVRATPGVRAVDNDLRVVQ